MDSLSRKEREKLNRRAEIINAAERVFFQKGYETATMDDLAKEAEFSKKTLYVYFSSKEQIRFEIMLRGYKLLLDMLEADDPDPSPNAVEQLRQMGERLFAFSNQHASYFELIIHYENGERDFDHGVPEQSRDESYELGEKVLGHLVEHLRNGQEQGSIRRDLEPLNIALTLWASILGIFKTAKVKRRYLLHYHRVETEAFLASSYDLLLSALQPGLGGEQG
ncbi:TetR/AcrR family transcriptional regulator [Gorillibacterium sp. CAU 1737]|uniref:TetR/AcrR family transcriptional regulator n=1 Tax=Gorillibacterium sp. CAU 1737 TaxID=3140362 RepID=UPI00325FF8FE